MLCVSHVLSWCLQYGPRTGTVRLTSCGRRCGDGGSDDVIGSGEVVGTWSFLFVPLSAVPSLPGFKIFSNLHLG